MSPIPLGILASTGGAGAYELIATGAIDGTNISGVLSFSNIPQGYKHLQIRASIRSTYNGGENFYMRFNSTTYTFSGHALNGNGSTVGSFNYTSANYADMMPIANAANEAGCFAGYVIDILDYSSTSKNKTIRGLGGFTGGSNSSIQLRSNLVMTTSPITSISEIGGTSGNGIADGSRISLYGIVG